MSGLSGDEKPLWRLNWTEIDAACRIVNFIVFAAYGGTSGGLWGGLALECDIEGH